MAYNVGAFRAKTAKWGMLCYVLCVVCCVLCVVCCVLCVVCCVLCVVLLLLCVLCVPSSRSKVAGRSDRVWSEGHCLFFLCHSVFHSKDEYIDEIRD